MKKIAVASKLMLVVAMVMAFTGCPRHTSEPGPSGSGQNVPPEPQIQQGLSFYINLNDGAEKAEKYGLYAGIPNSYLHQMGDAFKSKATYLELTICPSGGMGGRGKGGGYSNCLSPERFEIVGGICQGFVPVNSGSYYINARIQDWNDYDLFEAYADAEVNSGQNVKVGLEFNFLYQYPFTIGVYNLPQVAMQASNARILSYTNIEYYGSGHYESNRWVFNFDLPLDFPGGTMYFVDSNGNAVPDSQGNPLQWDISLVPWMLDWTTFSIGQEHIMAYQPNTAAGSISPDVSFAYESRSIRVSGVDFDSIGDAVKNSSSPMTIELGEGDYIGFWANGSNAKDVRIVGQGAIRTRLVRDQNDGSIVVMDPTATKGGGYRLVLENLSVSGYSNSGDWVDSSIKLWGCAFEAHNCYFEGSEMASLVQLAYPLGVFVDHCWFQANNNGAIWLDYYSPEMVTVQNSIFTGWNFEAVYMATYDVNGADGMILTNCCVSGGVPTGPEFIPVTNFIFADPLLNWQTKLPLPGSPCIGAATDGGNIGLLWAENGKG